MRFQCYVKMKKIFEARVPESFARIVKLVTIFALLLLKRTNLNMCLQSYEDIESSLSTASLYNIQACVVMGLFACRAILTISRLATLFPKARISYSRFLRRVIPRESRRKFDRSTRVFSWTKKVESRNFFKFIATNRRQCWQWETLEKNTSFNYLIRNN